MLNREGRGRLLDRLPTNVAVVAYRRPEHLRRCLEALSLNAESSTTKLTVYVDGPRFAAEKSQIDDVASVAALFTNFRELRIVRRKRNVGLSRSIIGAVEASLEERDEVIVLEDDLVVSPFFLRYMNEAIQRYKDDARVASIHGYVYPVGEPLPETFFLRGADCLGWGTWRSAWSIFETDGNVLLDRLERLPERTRDIFEFNKSYPYLQMLRSQIAGRNDSWAIRWYASAFLAERLTLYPGRSLVFHAGNDGSGTNVGTSTVLDVRLTKSPIISSEIVVEDNREARIAFERYFRQARSSPPRRKPQRRLTQFFARHFSRSSLRMVRWTDRSCKRPGGC